MKKLLTVLAITFLVSPQLLAAADEDSVGALIDKYQERFPNCPIHPAMDVIRLGTKEAPYEFLSDYYDIGTSTMTKMGAMQLDPDSPTLDFLKIGLFASLYYTLHDCKVLEKTHSECQELALERGIAGHCAFYEAETKRRN